MELILVQVVILVFLLTYLWAEEQATVYVTYNVNVVDGGIPQWLWDAYLREQNREFDEVLDQIERGIRHNEFTRKLTGV